MYKSPIEIISAGLQADMEGEILKAVYKYGIMVDKEELLRALEYDRDQYSLGYQAGKCDATKHGQWVEGRTLEKCSICGKKGFPDWYYCPNCGAKMDG